MYISMISLFIRSFLLIPRTRKEGHHITKYLSVDQCNFVSYAELFLILTELIR